MHWCYDRKGPRGIAVVTWSGSYGVQEVSEEDSVVIPGAVWGPTSGSGTGRGQARRDDPGHP